LRNEELSSRRKNKLMARGDGRYKVVKRAVENTYMIELPGGIQISTTLKLAISLLTLKTIMKL